MNKHHASCSYPDDHCTCGAGESDKVKELDERLAAAQKLQRLTLDNEVRWMRLHEKSEAKLLASETSRAELVKALEWYALIGQTKDGVKIECDSSMAKEALFFHGQPITKDEE